MSSTPSSRGMPTASVQSLVAQFDDVSISHPRQAGFVGGFKTCPESTTRGRNDRVEKPLPATPQNARPSSIPASLQPGHGRTYQPPSPVRLRAPQPFEADANAPPMSMPMPTPTPVMPSVYTDQSLTMAYARSAPANINQYPPSLPIPQPVDELVPPYFRHQYHSSVPSTTASSPLVTPLPATRTRASSTPPSPASSSGSTSRNSTVQCHGTTKAGKRCNRVVKAPPLVSFFAPASSEPVERFCFQHVREVLGQTGFYSHKQGGGWVKFSEWIPDYLHPDTQAALRIEMEKPSSSKDEPGYIYAYEIRDDRMPNEVKIKVGRAVKLVKRLDQWSKQCTSKEVILRGWWPGTVEDDEDTNGTSLLRGRIKAGTKGPLCHRLERLVHLELADLAVRAPYLEPGFPKGNSQASNVTSSPSTPGRSPKPSKIRSLGKPCVDCGAIHKEIFTFQRVQKGKLKGAEWEGLVQPVIARWGRFVGGYV